MEMESKGQSRFTLTHINTLESHMNKLEGQEYLSTATLFYVKKKTQENRVGRGAGDKASN